MPPWLKYGLIGCGTLLVLGVIVVGVAVWWFSRNAPRIASGLEAVVEEGRRAGNGTDEQGCVGLAMEYGGTGVRGMMRIPAFLEGCLRAARETPGFCDGLPRQEEFRRTVGWPAAQCRGSNNPRCSAVMQGKLRYCQEGRPKGGQVFPGIDGPVPPDTAAPADTEPVDREPIDDEPVDMEPIEPGALDTITP